VQPWVGGWAGPHVQQGGNSRCSCSPRTPAHMHVFDHFPCVHQTHWITFTCTHTPAVSPFGATPARVCPRARKESIESKARELAELQAQLDADSQELDLLKVWGYGGLEWWWWWWGKRR
jgi:hypothetical protein